MTKAPAVSEIKIHEDEDWTVAMEEWFGKSFFLSKTAPKTAQHQDNLAGILKRPLPLEPGKRRRQYERRWVIRKPARQEGAEPKDRRTISLPRRLTAATDARANQLRTGFSGVVELALAAYLQDHLSQ